MGRLATSEPGGGQHVALAVPKDDEYHWSRRPSREQTRRTLLWTGRCMCACVHACMP